jgi:hypothetical protein
LIDRRPIWTLALSAVCTLALVACATADAPSLKEPRAFQAYPVYYLGESAVGRPLEEVLGDPENQDKLRDTSWIFIYGECEDPPEGEGGCAPLQIHNYSTCIWASINEPRPNKMFDFRGAKAQWHWYDLEVFTGHTALKIAGGPRKLLLEAARSIREVHQARPHRPHRLHPPSPGVLSGRGCSTDPK